MPCRNDRARIECFSARSDDEGSNDEADDEEGEDDDDEDDDDEDYEDEEDEEEDEDAESPSFFFDKNPIQQQAWNHFQLTGPKTPASQPESTGDLSSMIANFNICSPFSFGAQAAATEVTPVAYLIRSRISSRSPKETNGPHSLN